MNKKLRGQMIRILEQLIELVNDLDGKRIYLDEFMSHLEFHEEDAELLKEILKIIKEK